MSTVRLRGLPAALLLASSILSMGAGAPRAAETASGEATVTVHAQPVTQTFRAYGQVQPIAPLTVSAITAGIVTGLKVVPGSAVRAGEALATLTGPEIESLLVSRQDTVRSARAQLATAERNLTIERRQLSAQMSTQQAVAAAQSAVAAAQAAFDTAQAQLRVAQHMQTLRAPSAGTVLAIHVAEGQRLMAGQAILTLQATKRLWLAAVYYGADAAAIRIGMTGKFQPAAYGSPLPVKVVAISAALAPDAGESIGLVVAVDDSHASSGHAEPPPWSNGERGAVIIEGATQSLLAVPTRALVLDQARWWVLVRTPKGTRAQAVVPGPARGWQTFIERGLFPGQQVVVQNAFLEYHHDIAQRYIPPD